ncbi:hypothetical protein [Flavobacterium rhizosphaerae]|uniref:Tetratricopeptide repeat-containing protein n=1 Tax=Flavobacterium rhizosphaerae TaxID=3163298 RepID=A0ABW8Z059_9FLAO
MKLTACNICNQDNVPLNNTLKVNGQVHCSNCLEEHFSHKDMLQDKVVEKEHDPTVCSFCNKDFEEKELGKLSVYPTCADCREDIKKKTFPLWVKGFFAAIIVIVVFAFVWNWKYYAAYNNIQDAFAYSALGDYHAALGQMEAAEAKVPEVYDLSVLSAYFRGIDFLANNKSEQALEEFKKCENYLPEEGYELTNLVLQARMGVAFDKKDYDGFLESALLELDTDSTLAANNAAVASAYACIYASKDDEAAKEKSLEYLAKAQALDTANADKNYYNIIEYRLSSKNIMSREEFNKKYPNGWTKN